MVTIYERKLGSEGKPGLSRRELLKRGGASALLVISGSAVISPEHAWGLETSTLKPETMATLIQMARDIYPHDQVPDKYYAIAVKAHDEQAGKDPAHKDLVEKGIADLDSKSGKDGYTGLGWEEQRVAVLKQIESTPFFQAVRGGLVVGLYNQKEVWPIFGYEGESYSKGGYIARGFDDIEWL
ncbi:conserved hypothetical protein [Mesorhizobium metallidurans STM 2683]|uniref:Twin-arginine translocation pathway signal n=1 Tax=Mesorhizobium metallidurans STM 2683 TaxID=1297569 RepID=M5ESX9_9HYPH|nr:hypothetical protein [Mesorhizobium metallidurans]CCV07108.1 conserved hypothetical protein [Mesorhizobium metallidurans STM 2683]